MGLILEYNALFYKQQSPGRFFTFNLPLILTTCPCSCFHFFQNYYPVAKHGRGLEIRLSAALSFVFKLFYDALHVPGRYVLAAVLLHQVFEPFFFGLVLELVKIVNGADDRRSVMLCCLLYSTCFLRRRLISESALFMEPVSLSA